jgi:AraC-like DNA-binding protein
MTPPWSVRIEDRAPLSIVAMVRGDAAIAFDDEPDPMWLHEGELAIVRGPDPYTFADPPGTAPQAVIHPGQVCETPDGIPLDQSMGLGVRSWGNDPEGATMMLVGTYEKAGAISARMLGALPRTLKVQVDAWSRPLVDLLAAEVVRDEPGQEVVLDRLLDLLVVGAVRQWMAGEAASPWHRAATDPVVAPAIRLLKGDPARAWTVASLAAEVGVSRALLARRFTDAVGEPPMAFLTEWRLALAADLLRDTDATIGAVAHQVGYGSPFALSTAFKRAHGVSPKQYRAGGPATVAGRAASAAGG